MKKLLIITAIAFLPLLSYSQIEVGVKVSPAISYSRVIDDIDEFDAESGSAGFRFVGGPFIDIFFADNYALTGGLMYSTSKSSVQFKGMDETVDYSLQYLEIPLGVKLYTNEVADLLKIYLHLGATLDFKIAEKFLGDDDQIEIEGTYAKFIDSKIHVGAGVEIPINTSNKLIGGISYYRGLVNTVTKDWDDLIAGEDDVSEEFKISNDLITLDIGYKF